MAKSRTNFGVCCPWCHDEEATIALDLNNFNAITCSSCDRTFSATEARDHAADVLARWEAIARWIAKAAPVD